MMERPVLGEQDEGGAAGNQRGINGQFVRALVAPDLEAFHLAFIRVGKSNAGVLKIVGAIADRHCPGAIHRHCQAIAAAGGKMSGQQGL